MQSNVVGVPSLSLFVGDGLHDGFGAGWYLIAHAVFLDQKVLRRY